jgi:bacterioferritin-associated ferredoxin
MTDSNRKDSSDGSGRSNFPKKKKREIVCLCNDVSKDEIEAAIRSGAHTLNQIFDKTTAGVGPCGGSCRRKLQPLLDHYLSCGEFLETLPKTLSNGGQKNKRGR